MKFVIDSKDEENLLTFLEPDAYEGPKLATLKLHQYQEFTGRSLFEHFLEICVREVFVKTGIEVKFFKILLSLLDEIELIKDLNALDKILGYSEDAKFYMELLPEDLKALAVDHEAELQSKLHSVDQILATILVYCDKSDENFPSYKQKLTKSMNPIYKMVFDVIEGKEKDFIQNFAANVQELERLSQTLYNKSNISDFIFVILMAAIKHSRKSVIDCIFQNFSKLHFDFPPNMKCSESGQFVAEKLLQNDRELGEDKIPKDWLTPQVFESFLDSQISYKNEDLIKIDTSFMIHRLTKKQQVKGPEDVDNKLLFWESTKSLQFILDHELLKNSITHPVISTYIDLKTYKQKRTLYFDFLMLLVFVLVPFALSQNFSQLFLLFPIFFLAVREAFQFKFIEKTWENYSSNLSNQIKLSSIFVFTFTLILRLSTISTLAVFYFGLIFLFIVHKLYHLDRFSFTTVLKYLMFLVLPFVSFVACSFITSEVDEIFEVRCGSLVVMVVFLVVKVCMRFRWLDFVLMLVLPLPFVFDLLDHFGINPWKGHVAGFNYQRVLLMSVPVVFGYIARKMYQFKRYPRIVFIHYLLVFVLPFVAFVVSEFVSLEVDFGIDIQLTLLLFPILVLILGLVIRFIQTKSLRLNRFAKFDLSIVFSLVLILIITQNFFELNNEFTCLAIISIFLITASFLMTLPFDSMQINMMMLKKVAMTSLKFFIPLCLSILIAYTISFCLIFGDNFEVEPKNSTECADGEDDDPLDNFKSYDSAFVKLILMLSGEYTVEPIALTIPQLILFATFILITVILFNLILGLAIDDVQKLKSEARELILIENAKKFIKAHKYYREIYNDYSLDILKTSELDFTKKLKVKFLEFLLSAYPFVHKIDKFYIDIHTRKIMTMVNGIKETIINSELNVEAFERTKKILKNRNKKSKSGKC
jgi:hypothetical protein